jgi:hypothetical protein
MLINYAMCQPNYYMSQFLNQDNDVATKYEVQQFNLERE